MQSPPKDQMLEGMIDRAVDLAADEGEQKSPWTDADDVCRDMVEAIHQLTKKPRRYIRRVFKSKFGITVKPEKTSKKAETNAA